MNCVTMDDINNLGWLLDRQEEYYEMCESNGTSADLGYIALSGRGCVDFHLRRTPIGEISGQFNLDDIQTLIYYEDTVAQMTRGNVTAGQNILSTLQIPDVFPDGYAAQDVIKETAVNDSDWGTLTYTYTLGGGGALVAPINPQICIFYGTVAVTVSSDPYTATFTGIIPDPDTGNFSQVIPVSDSAVPISLYGNIDYATGVVNFYISGVTAENETAAHLYVDYQVLAEAGTDLPTVNLKLVAKLVRAQVWTLKSDFGLLEAFLLRKRHGFSAEERVARNLTTAVNQEIMNRAVKLIVANCPDSSISWTRQPQSGVDYWSHLMTLKHAIADMSSLIVTTAGRGFANVLLAGREAATVISTLPGFKLLFDNASFGAHVYGTLDGVSVIRMPFNSVLDDNTIYGLYKGNSPEENFLAYCPFMPLVMTPTLPIAFNPLQSMRGAAVWAGLQPLVTSFAAKLTIVETYSSGTPFNYGSASA